MDKEKKKQQKIEGNDGAKLPTVEQPQPQPSNEEQMMRRQSAPRPTAEEEAQRMLEQRQQGGAMNGFKALAQMIGKEQVHKASQILQKYKEGKANLEQRIVDNEQWYKLRHWDCLRDKSQEIQPTSAWLFNAIENKVADAMDNVPSCNCLPREEADKGEAEMLSAIIPVILDQNDFEETYCQTARYKFKMGTGVYGVFWDNSKLNGLGDISIKKVDLINLFWESGIQDIQKSRNFFHVELADNDLLVSAHPQLQGKLTNATIDVAKYAYDDTVDTNNKSVVVDWYYKKQNAQGKTVLHYCKYVNDEVLFATENEPNFAERGWYDHGLYPFVFDPLFTTEGTPTGFGIIDVFKDAQAYIDRGNQAIMKNMLANAKPRYFIRSDGSVNEQEYADTNADFIHVDGNLGEDSVKPVQPNTLNNIYVEIINNKINELKETSGNRDVSTGGTTGGVTAASGLAAMQEASAKLSRLSNKSAYRAFRKVCLMVIELIRQFYDLPRQFRIVGENGMARFIQYSNANISPQQQGVEMGVDLGYRLPLFDLEIEAQKKSVYTRQAQNELALQFYKSGFFNPQLADQALACLDMMDFDRKHIIMQKIAQNAMAFRQMMMQQQMTMQGSPSKGSTSSEKTEAIGGEGEEPSHIKKAKQRVAESTSPA